MVRKTTKEADQMIQQRMLDAGLGQLPARVLCQVEISNVTIPHEQTLNMRKVAELVTSIKGCGTLLQPPSLGFEVGSTITDCEHLSEAHLRVLCGRHRFKSACLVAAEQGSTTVLCFVYFAVFSPTMAALVSSTENFLRGEDWRHEVVEIKELIEKRIPLSEDELVTHLGLKRPVVRQRMALARLPEPLVQALISDKTVSIAVARRMSRLSIGQQQRLSTLVQAGRPLTEELITAAWSDQVNGGLEEVAPAFTRVLDLQVDQHGRVCNERSVQTEEGEFDVTERESIALVLEHLERLARSLHMPSRLASLTTYYQQELRSWQRDVQREENSVGA